ncbi:hypothetical protein BSKO_06170 [Bryopsis sp. KO-2023]|nr:hypothetical protein BSKO_06170 [Bryopsis sp. KO-2023]
MGYHDLVLDRQVLVWVLIPLTVAVTLMMLLRQYAHQYLNAGNSGPTKSKKDISESQAVLRSQKLREQSSWITEAAYKQRKNFFADKDTGILYQAVESRSIQETMATDPSMMVNMLKSQLTGLVPQIMMGAWVNHFFAGFVLGKVPISLSPRFRPMLQRGIDLVSLDVSYFTSLSYYILLLFGMRGLFSLFFREDTIDDTDMVRRQMNPMGGMGPAFDVQKAFDAEKDLLELHEHQWRLVGVEQRACLVLKHLLATQ